MVVACESRVCCMRKACPVRTEIPTHLPSVRTCTTYEPIPTQRANLPVVLPVRPQASFLRGCSPPEHPASVSQRKRARRAREAQETSEPKPKGRTGNKTRDQEQEQDQRPRPGPR